VPPYKREGCEADQEQPDVVHFVDPIWLGAQTLVAMELGWAGEEWVSEEGPAMGAGVRGAVVASYHTSWLEPIMWKLQQWLYSKCASPAIISFIQLTLQNTDNTLPITFHRADADRPTLFRRPPLAPRCGPVAIRPKQAVPCHARQLGRGGCTGRQGPDLAERRNRHGTSGDWLEWAESVVAHDAAPDTLVGSCA
jgi:hypothetical protein